MAAKQERPFKPHKPRTMWIDPLTKRIWRVIETLKETKSVVWRADDWKKSDAPSFGYGYIDKEPTTFCDEAKAREMASQ